MIFNKIRTIFTLLAISFSTMLSAQVVKEITVSQKESYTDHLSLKKDTRDMDLMVKFGFNEEANTLTVSLISYRCLFVFWERVRFKPTFRCRKLRPKMLPYVAQFEPGDRFRISKALKKSLPRPRRKYVFNRWNTYDGLQPVPQDYKLVNDYISQTFGIMDKRNQVSFTLRDVFVMEHTDYNDYELMFGKDINTQYQITIQRDPCFGKDEQLKGAQDAEKSIATAYASFKQKYGSGKVYSDESLKLFHEMQDVLMGQFARQDITSPCPDIQQAWDSYNLYTDSIRQMTCKVVYLPSTNKSGTGMSGQGNAANLMASEPEAAPTGILPRSVLQKARQIDQMVARWLNSTDSMERRAIIMQCGDIIKRCNEEISTQGVVTPEQKQAVDVFRKAVRYYYNICK